MEKINILTLGGCAADDILRANRNHTNLYNIDVWIGSISRQYWEPGKVASRLKEDMSTILPRITDTKVKIPTTVQWLYTIKEYRTPQKLLESLTPNSVVIVDPAYEIQNFYFDGNEIFDVHLMYDSTVRKHMPDWYNLAVNKYYTRYDNGIMELTMFQYHTSKAFMAALEKMKVPVIVIDNLYTNKIYDPITNSVGSALPLYVSKMPFALKGTVLENHDYSTKLIEKFYELYKRVVPSSFKIFSPDVKKIYADPNHHQGYHPTHLHHTCRTVLNDELNALIVEAVADHKAKQPLILPNKTS